VTSEEATVKNYIYHPANHVSNHVCFSHRVICVWNILPECVNFTTYNAFKQSLTTSVYS